MRDYGVVSPKFWIGGTGKALRGNPDAQIVALYLMTSPHANMIGVFYCPLDTIAKETGIPIEGATKALQSLVAVDFCQFDPLTEEVFAVRMAAYQIGEQLEAKDNRCKGVARELERVMSDRLKSAFRAIYSIAFHLPTLTPKPHPPAPPPASPLQAPSKPEAGTEAGTGSEDSAKAGGDAADLTKAELWSAGKSLLSEQGMPKAQCGTFVGKLVSDYGEAIVVDAVRVTVVARPADAAEYLKATCMRAAGQRAGKTGTPSKHAGFAGKNYREGIADDGSFN